MYLCNVKNKETITTKNLNKMKKTIEGINFWAFVNDPAPLPENVSICNGEDIKKWLESKYNSGPDALVRTGLYKKGGWEFNFRPYLNKYIYKYPDGGIFIGFAPSVKALRNALYLKPNVKVANCPKNF